jgi:hypothetical protein
MLSDLLLLFLFLVQSSLLTLLFKAAFCPGLGKSFLVVKYGLVIDILQRWYFGDEGFAVVGDFFVEAVILQIYN